MKYVVNVNASIDYILVLIAISFLQPWYLVIISSLTWNETAIAIGVLALTVWLVWVSISEHAQPINQ